MDEIRNLRNKYRGRAWIVGTGPSLDITPLDKLIGEACFGINRIGQKFDNTEWRPQFFFCSTGQVMDSDYHDDVVRALAASEISFFSYKLMKLMDLKALKGNLRKLHWLEFNHSSSEERNIMPKDGWWNPLSIEQGFISNFGTSAFGCSQILAYMGFDPIYLVGCDMGYKEHKPGKADPNHFGDDYESGKFHMPQVVHNAENPRRIMSHEIMQRQIRRAGGSIYNATIGGELEVYKRVDFHAIV